VSEIPDLLWCVDGVYNLVSFGRSDVFPNSLTCVVGVHDTSVVEHDVETTPRVDLLDGSSNIGLLADIADSGLNLASSVGNDLLDLGDGLLESRCRDVAHQD